MTTLQQPEGDLGIDLSSDLALNGQAEQEYIDYSDDEPEPQTYTHKPNPESASETLVAEPGPDPSESSHTMPIESADLTANSTDPEPAAPNEATEVQAGGDAMFSRDINASHGVSTEQSGKLNDERHDDDVITWEVDEDVQIGQAGESDENTNNVEADDQNGQTDQSETRPLDQETPNDLMIDAQVAEVGEQEDAHSQHDSYAEATQVENAAEISNLLDASSHAADDVQGVNTGSMLSHQGEDVAEIDYEDDEESTEQALDKSELAPNDGLGADQNDQPPPENDNDAEDEMDEEHIDHEQLQDPEERALRDQALDDVLNEDSPSGSLDTPVDGDGDLPSILVTWHGVEYPLFYDSPGSEDKQCFFDDINLMHCAIEELLASFRRELAGDVADTDELVLQVDEMGLEFAESSQSAQFLDITLGSILQVFNDLVRNQDPGASRPLCAYLITRPNCSKRWQSLIEDAYQGKNIEEVSICFPREQHATIPTDGHAIIGDGDAGDDDEHYALDKDPDEEGEADFGLVDEEQFNQNDEHIESNQEESFDKHEGGMALNEDEQQTAESSALPDPVQELEPAISELDDSTAMAMLDEDTLGDFAEQGEEQGGTVAENSDRNGKYAALLIDPCYQPDICFCERCWGEVEKEQSRGDEATFRRARYVRNEAGRILSHPSSKTCTTFAPEACRGPTSAHMTSSTSTLAEADRLHQVSEDFDDPHTRNNNTSVSEPQTAIRSPGDDRDNDALADPEHAPETSAEPVTTEPTTTTKYATALLNGDDDDAEFHADFNADFDLNADIDRENTAEATLTKAGDDFDEIDWRDFPGQGDDDVQEASAVSGKRPRSEEDDVADAENEQDVKRRRS